MSTNPVQSHGCFALDHLREEDFARVIFGHALQVGEAYSEILQPALDQSSGPFLSMIPHIRAVVTIGFPPGAFTELSIRCPSDESLVPATENPVCVSIHSGRLPGASK